MSRRKQSNPQHVHEPIGISVHQPVVNKQDEANSILSTTTSDQVPGINGQSNNAFETDSFSQNILKLEFPESTKNVLSSARHREISENFTAESNSLLGHIDLKDSKSEEISTEAENMQSPRCSSVVSAVESLINRHTVEETSTDDGESISEGGVEKADEENEKPEDTEEHWDPDCDVMSSEQQLSQEKSDMLKQRDCSMSSHDGAPSVNDIGVLLKNDDVIIDERSSKMNSPSTHQTTTFSGTDFQEKSYTHDSIMENDEDLDASVEEEKENLNTTSMFNFIQKSREQLKSSKSEPMDESKELEMIKDQVRMLQQQQMYQVHMLNYLQFQLTVIASNPQNQSNQPALFQSSGINRIQLQNMPQLLAAAVSMNGQKPSGLHPPTNLFPQMAPGLVHQTIDESQTQTNEHSEKVELNQTYNRDSSGKMSQNISDQSSPNDSYNPLSSLVLLQKSSTSLPSQNEFANESFNLNRISEPNADSSLLKHTCRFCQKCFGSDSALQIHLRSHTGERPYKCNICANRFSTKGNLKVHFTRHQEKYPHIEMNADPIPEYLDNVPRISGISYGMSIIPDYHDGKSSVTDESTAEQFTSLEDKPLVELPAPFKAVDSEEFALHKEETSAEEASVNYPATSIPTNHSNYPERKHSNNSNGTLRDDEVKPVSNYSNLSSSPSVSLASKEIAEMYRNNSPKTTSSISADMQDYKKLGSEIRKYSPEIGGNHDVMLQKSMTSSSETSKLQKLVEKIDRVKELEKNECHICHRVLSCQSALKLHYRTHTGERPYKCDLCSRAFTTRGNLRTHYSSVHRQQLRNSPSDGANSGRGSTLQCPLCGSRFMDQQSLQQHMQMHLFIHNQQQKQQVAHMINSHVPQIDCRMLGMVGGGFPVGIPSSTASVGSDRSLNDRKADADCAENDDVFDENLSDNNEDAQIFNSGSRDMESPNQTIKPTAIVNEDLEEDNAKSERSLSNDNSAHNFAHSSPSRSPYLPSKADELKRNESPALDSSALDLTQSQQHSTTSDPSSATSARSMSEALASSLRMPPMQSVTNSLSALANLASSNALMRPNGLPMMNLQMASSSDDIRSRKMTTACEMCNKPFTCQSALEIHLRSHTKERPYICRICDRGFTTKGNLKQHLLTHNINEIDDEMLEAATSPLTGNSGSCSPVSSPFQDGPSTHAVKRPLEASQSAPVAKRAFPRHWCHICQKQFSSASSLQIHNRTHTGEKPFACSVCGRAFTTKGNLKVHMGTHVWGAGGSRRGRRISMDNPLISPWMQNTSSSNAINPPLRPRLSPQIPTVPDPAALYQQYAAIASSLAGAKAASDARLSGAAMLNFSNAAAARLLIPNNHVTAGTAATSVEQSLNPALKDNNGKTITAAAQEWIWKAYQRTQEQVN